MVFMLLCPSFDSPHEWLWHMPVLLETDVILKCAECVAVKPYNEVAEKL